MRKSWDLRAGLVPFIAAGIALTAYILQTAFPALQAASLLALLQDTDVRTVYAVIAVCALIESLVFVAYYFPGTAIIVGVIIIKGDQLNRPGLVLLMTVSAFLGIFINWRIGLSGRNFFLRLVSKELINHSRALALKARFPATILTAAHFNYIALLFLGVGLLALPSRIYFLTALLSLPIWLCAWTYGLPLIVKLSPVTGSNYQLWIAAAFILVGVIAVIRSNLGARQTRDDT